MSRPPAFDHDADFARAVQLHLQGNLGEAERGYRSLIKRNTPIAAVYSNLATLSLAAGRTAESVDLLKYAVRLQPKFADAYANLGTALYGLGNSHDAALASRAALQINPHIPEAYSNLGNILKDQGRLEEAVAAYRRAVELKPDFVEAHCYLGIAFYAQGKLEDSAASYRRALALRPDFTEAYSGLIFTVSFGQMASQADILQLTRGFEAAVCRDAGDATGPQRIRSPSDKLRIGFVSAEIGQHSVSYFLEAYLRNYDRSRYRVHLYPTVRRSEGRAHELLQLADKVRDISHADDRTAREMIVADRLDILIETSSHTYGGRLRMLARRVAPVQCHYIGFSGSSGISSMDYFIGDNEVTPPEFEVHFHERICRLPRTWIAYSPPRDLSTPEQASPAGEITLGCFNNLMKVREETLDFWAPALVAVPRAKLLLKDSKAADGYTRERIVASLEARGVSAVRIEFAERIPSWAEHMKLYNRVDIALDTCPFSSATTAFDALLMATPVIAIRGDWMGGRMSSSIIKGLGRPEWIANSPGDYAAIIARLALDLPALKAHKTTLRAEVLASPLCDGQSLARALEAAFDRMAADQRVESKAVASA